MPATFSISVGTPTEAARLSDIYSALQNIPDNTQKLISPKDVRDAIFSVWANSVFKQTSGTASIEYIGIDSNNPDNRDVKQKILIGKRNTAGVDVMKPSLLSGSNDTDIYFFNTKSDSATQSITKISILSGTLSSLHDYAPYIKSEYIGTMSGDRLSLEIGNPSIYGGPVNILSSTGRVAINGIILPTIAESTASASNGKILRYSGSYPNGSLIWSNDTVSIANIGATGSPTTIYGSPVLVNGSSLEFVDTTPLPLPVGGFNMGMTFASGSYQNGTYSQDWPIVAMLERILYPYVPPVLTLSMFNAVTGTRYAEMGTTAVGVLSYSITRYSYDVVDAQIPGTTFTGIFLVGSPGDIISGTVTGLTSSPSPLPKENGAAGTTPSWTLEVSDSILMAFSYSATASLTYVNPVFYSFDTTDFPIYGGGTYASGGIATVMNNSSKLIKPYPGASQSFILNYNGFGYLYFLHQSGTMGYPTNVKLIKDPNGYVVHDSNSWNTSAFTMSAPIFPFYSGTDYGPYTVWRTIATCSYPGGNFEFIF